MQIFTCRHAAVASAPFVTALLGCLLLAACSDGSQAADTAPQPRATAVTVASVQQQRFSDQLEALGTARASESVTVSANITEKIVSLHFDDGADVEKGDLLAKLDDSAERADLAAARAQLAERQKTLARARSLIGQQVVSESEVDLRAAEVETARAAVQAIEAALADHRILAPFSGRLGLRMVSAGALIRPGDAITTLDAIDTIKLDFSVPETVLGQLKQGTLLEATVAAYPGETFTGEIAAVDTRIDPATRSVLARALVQNPQRKLQPGMLIELQLLAEQREGLSVPESALVPRGTQQFVYRVDGDAAQWTEVKIGSRRDGVVEIIDGISADDRVVVDGTLKLRPGAPIDIVERSDVLGSSTATSN